MILMVLKKGWKTIKRHDGVEKTVVTANPDRTFQAAYTHLSSHPHD